MPAFFGFPARGSFVSVAGKCMWVCEGMSAECFPRLQLVVDAQCATSGLHHYSKGRGQNVPEKALISLGQLGTKLPTCAIYRHWGLERWRREKEKEKEGKKKCAGAGN